MGREELVKKLHRICSQYPDILGRVILFGSYSRGEEGEASDIDLYIEPSDLSVTTAKIGSSKRYKEFKYSLYDSFDNEFDLMTYGGKRENEMRESKERIPSDVRIQYSMNAPMFLHRLHILAKTASNLG